MQKLAKVGRNGVLPARKLRLALMASDGKRPLHFGNKPAEEWADAMGNVIRLCLGKYRELKQSATKLNVCLRSVSRGLG
eukprot:4834809-Alexandrium_andersonii.AAC.1